jgi:hypothetical protein
MTQLAAREPEALALFDVTPIALGPFKLRARDVVVSSPPTLEQWSAAYAFATHTVEASPYWLGDLLAYAGTRADWGDRLDQAQGETGLARQTLINLAYVSRRVDQDARAVAPSHTHAAAVAKLDPPAQIEWLQAAATEGWTARELIQQMRGAPPRAVAAGSAAKVFAVEVTVRVSVEAENAYAAEEAGWVAIKAALVSVPHVKVIAASAYYEEKPDGRPARD